MVTLHYWNDSEDNHAAPSQRKKYTSEHLAANRSDWWRGHTWHYFANDKGMPGAYADKPGKKGKTSGFADR